MTPRGFGSNPTEWSIHTSDHESKILFPKRGDLPRPTKRTGFLMLRTKRGPIPSFTSPCRFRRKTSSHKCRTTRSDNFLVVILGLSSDFLITTVIGSSFLVIYPMELVRTGLGPSSNLSFTGHSSRISTDDIQNFRLPFFQISDVSFHPLNSTCGWDSVWSLSMKDPGDMGRSRFTTFSGV